MVQRSQEVASQSAAEKKQKLPAGRGLFAVSLTAALGLLLWLNILSLGAVVLTCFLYLVYLITETTEAIYDQLAWLRYETAQLSERQESLAVARREREVSDVL